MFKKLKRKMLTLNLTILTVLLILVLTALYITNYRNVQQNIEFELNKITANESFRGPELPPVIQGEDILADRSVSFVIITDLNGTITDSFSSFEAEDSLFTEALLSVDGDRGTFDLEESHWAYRVVTYNSFVAYGFLDTTSEQVYLSTMLYSFIGVFVISFLAVYFISSYITKRSVDGIREAFVKQKQFIANASHELKTPLAIISTNADILIESDKKNKWLNNIKYETERMNKLTKDLLYLTKMSEQIPDEIIKSRVNLSELTESTILTFEALAYGKNINVEYHITPKIFAEIDPNQFSQVLHTLLDNAIKYAPKSGKVYIKLENVHNNIVYSIENSGEGINQSDLNNIFDRFYMGDKSRSENEKSYGLGLSIAKTIIDNHQGKIYCESIKDEKTTFYIKLKNKYL
jgi:two-component sensor histidine kinase